MMFIWIIILFVLGYVLIKDESKLFQRTDDNPLQTLKRRLVQGEITMDEYQRIKQLIEEENK